MKYKLTVEIDLVADPVTIAGFASSADKVTELLNHEMAEKIQTSLVRVEESVQASVFAYRADGPLDPLPPAAAASWQLNKAGVLQWMTRWVLWRVE